MAYRSSTHLGGGNSETVAPTVPSGATSGDIAIVAIYKENTAAVTPPAGFTLKTTVTSPANYTLSVFWKRLTGADSGTYSFSWTGLAWRDASCALFSGRVASGDPFDGSPTTATATSTSVTCAALSPAASGDDLVSSAINTQGGDGAWGTAPTGMTARQVTSAWVAMWSADNVASGSTGTKTMTAWTSDAMAGFLGALLPQQVDAAIPPIIVMPWRRP